MSEWISEEDRLQVDVYWPRDGGYGCPQQVGSLEEASAVVQRLRKGGYGGPGTHSPSVIQVHRIRCDRLPIEALPDPPKESTDAD